MKIPCSNCNQRLEIPEELAGQTIECPACNASLAVPSLEPTAPPTPKIQLSKPEADSAANQVQPSVRPTVPGKVQAISTMFSFFFVTQLSHFVSV